jgi:putative transcriptional regulator
MISHHPAPELLADCARGELDFGATLAVAAHIDACALCREEIALWESVGGALLQEEMPAPLSHDAFERVAGRLDAPRPVAVRNEKKELPGYLRSFSIPGPLQALKFGRRLWVTPNIWFAPIATPAGDSARTYLVYAKPNTKLSKHTHTGREFTVVLHGAFRDGTGLYGPGDFAETDDAILHTPTVTGESDCLCFTSADAPMRLTNPIARAIQVLTGRFY